MSSNAKTFLILLISLLIGTKSFGQSEPVVDSTKYRKYRTLLYGSAIIYTASLAGLGKIWYSDKEKNSFRFFNDNPEWYQMDKAGHSFSAYHISRTTDLLLRKSGMKKSRALFWSTLAGPVLLLPIEILDGFSAAYGASIGDVIANTSGSLLYWGQLKLWDQPLIKPKFSFQRSPMAVNRPEMLGNGLHEELIKDYNGQTYWLSFDLYKLAGENFFPRWLNLALGYGVDNVVHAREKINHGQGFDGHRQFFLALDLDLSHVESRHSFINTLIYLVDLIHIPAPAIEYNRVSGFRFHPLHF